MKKLLPLLFLFLLSTISFGQELTSKITEVKPGELSKALAACPDGGTLKLEGVFYEGLSISGKYKQGITIDGQNKTIFFAYNGNYNLASGEITFEWDGVTQTMPFNPAVHGFLRNWKCISFNDAQNVKVKNLQVWGGCSESINLNDSYPETGGLHDILLENVTALYGGSRGIFSGGHLMYNIILKNCKVKEACYGDTTHCIYFSGSRFDPKYPPCENFQVIGCEVGFSGGRHCIQFNGRFNNVVIENNKLWHGQLSGLSLIGVQHAIIRNNVIYGNNRQAIVCFVEGDVSDPKWDDPAQIAWYKSVSQPFSDLLIENNTMMDGPEPWRVDPWHSDYKYTKDQPVILINNWLDGLKGISYPSKNIIIKNNVMWSPNQTPLSIYNMLNAQGMQFSGNIICCKAGQAGVWYQNTWYSLTDLAKFFPEQCGNNQEWKEINFKVFPEYPFIDCGADPNYWFGSQYKEVGDLHCPDAAELGKGIFPKGPMSIKGQEVIQGKKIPGTLPIEKTDPE